MTAERGDPSSSGSSGSAGEPRLRDDSSLGASSDAGFELGERALERGWISKEQLEAAIRACEADPGLALPALLPLTADQIRELGLPPPSRPVPPEVSSALADPKNRFGRYAKLAEIRSGGMGKVFRAWDTELGREVALKFPKHAATEGALETLVREARLAAALDHPSIAKVYEAGTHEGMPFIAMQFIRGRTLREAARELPRDRLVRHVRDMAAAVQFAHERGIVHRDLKPANAMVDGAGRVYVLDFGLARETALEEGTLGTTIVAGTPSYMAPEQALGKVSPSSDVYSLGATLYEIVTGRPPFVGETSAAVLARLLREEPVWPRKLAPDLPRDLEAIVLKCLEKDRKRRYATAAELVSDLDAYLGSSPLRYARRPTLVDRLAKSARRQPLAWALGATAVCAVASGIGFGWFTLLERNRELEGRVRAEENGRQDAQRLARTSALGQVDLEEAQLAKLHELRDRGGPNEAEVAIAAAQVCSSATGVSKLLGSLERDPRDEGSAALADARRRCEDVRRSAETIAYFAASRLLTPRGPSVLGRAPRLSGVAFSPAGDAIAVGADDLVCVRDGNGKPVRVLAGHTDAVTACAFSPGDGATVLSASLDGTLRLWDRGSGRCVRVLPGRGHALTACAFSPDGRAVLSGADDGTLEIRSCETGELERAIPGEPRVRACSFSPGGERIVRACSDGTVAVLDRASGRRVLALRSGDPARACAFSPDGRLLVHAAATGTLAVRDAESGVLRARLEGHARGVLSCAFSPDGKRIVSASWDGTLRLWDSSTGACQKTLVGHADAVTACAFSPSGEKLASVSDDRTLALWDTASGRRVAALPRPQGPVSSCALSPDPDEKEVLAGSWEGKLRVFDRATGRVAESYERTGRVLSCAFSPDGREVLSGSSDGSLTLATRGGEVRKIAAHGDQVAACAFSKDGKRIVSASWDGSIKTWERDGSLAHSLDTGSGRVLACALSPDSSEVLAASEDRTLGLWNAGTGARREALRGQAEPAWACSWAGDELLTASLDGTLALWDGASGRLRRTFGGRSERPLSACALPPSGPEVLGGSEDGKMILWDGATGSLVGSLAGHEALISACAFSRDGREILSASLDGTVRIRENPARPLARTFQASAPIVGCRVLPDGARIATASMDGNLQVWERASGRLLRTVEGPKRRVHLAAFSPDGNEVVVGFGFEVAEIWDTGTGERRAVLEGHRATLAGCAYAAGGREIMTWSADRTIRRWDRASGRLLATFEKHADMVTGCALSPDGSTCFSAGRDGTLELWESSTGAASGMRLPASSQPETACAYSPEGTQLLSVSDDRTLSLWDRASGRLVRTFTGHEAAAVACAFSPDGRTIASGSVDGKVIVWDRASGRPLETFDARSGVPSGVTISYAPGSGEILSIHADGVLRVWSLGTPLPFDEVFSGFASDPLGSVRRALHGISFRGTPRIPEPGDLPSLVLER